MTSKNPPKTDPELEKIKADLSETKQKLNEMTDAAKHALADLANYRKRVEEEKQGIINFANITFLMGLLPILDNFERATKSETLSQGLDAIYKQFKAFFEKIGLKQIETVGQKFSTNLHEALLEDPGEKDLILEELEKGYTLKDRVIRPAKVKVGNGKTA